MTLIPVSGDPLLTRAQYLAFGANIQGRPETTPLETRLMDAYPAAFAAYRKQCQHTRIKTGAYWAWRETQPPLLFFAVRESPVGATRLRYVQAVALDLARSYRLEGMTSLALAPLGSAYEWPEIKLVLARWLDPIDLPVYLYDTVQPGVQVDEG
jgi:hypothetical protein